MKASLIAEAEQSIDEINSELSNGFIVCRRCGDQEETNDLDVMSDLIKLQENIKLIGDCS